MKTEFMNDNKTLELAPVEKTGTLATIPAGGGITIEMAFQAAATRALDKESLGVMKELLAMDAQRKFNAAFVDLQRNLPPITATSVILNRGKYEKFEDLMRVVGPILTANGFTVSFSNDCKDGRIIETCYLSHVGGHTRENSFAVRVGRGDDDTQKDCKAATTAKRNAFMNALNIVIRQDCLNEENDAGMEGDPNAKVTEKQAEELEHRLKMVTGNVPAFLALAKAKTFAEIPANRYEELSGMIARKERGR